MWTANALMIGLFKLFYDQINLPKSKYDYTYNPLPWLSDHSRSTTGAHLLKRDPPSLYSPPLLFLPPQPHQPHLPHCSQHHDARERDNDE